MNSSESKKSRNNDSDKLMKKFLDLSKELEQQDTKFHNTLYYMADATTKKATDIFLETEKMRILNEMFIYSQEIAKYGNDDQFQICKGIILKYSPNSLLSLNFFEGIALGESVKKESGRSSNIFVEKSQKTKEKEEVRRRKEEIKKRVQNSKPTIYYKEIQTRNNTIIGDKKQKRAEKLAEKLAEKNRKEKEKEEMKKIRKEIDERVSKQKRITESTLENRNQQSISNSNKSKISSFLTKLFK